MEPAWSGRLAALVEDLHWVRGGSMHAIIESMITFYGPVPVGGIVEPMCIAPFDLAANGYVQEEFFVSGTASCYDQVGAAGSDGRWVAEVSGSVPFRTRIIVRRPEDPSRCSGTLLLEWLNVSSGFEADIEWAYMWEEILRARHVYVAVSAQLVGVHGGEGILGFSGPFPGLRAMDPARYDTLAIPGDQYSFDIFRRVGLALGPPRGGAAEPGERAARRSAGRVLGGLAPVRVLALGESQSAYYLTSYINAIHPLSPVFDGFLVHSRGLLSWRLAWPTTRPRRSSCPSRNDSMRAIRLAGRWHGNRGTAHRAPGLPHVLEPARTVPVRLRPP